MGAKKTSLVGIFTASTRATDNVDVLGNAAGWELPITMVNNSSASRGERDRDASRNRRLR